MLQSLITSGTVRRHRPASGARGELGFINGRILIYPLIFCLCLAATAPVSAADSSDPVFADRFELRFAALNYIVVWEDDADGNGFNDLRGIGRGSPGFNRRLNGDTAGEQQSVTAAIADNGDFVAVWANDPDLNTLFNIRMRGFNPDGSERFSSRNVNVDSDGQQLSPDIAMAPNGDFVVVWADDRDGNGFYQIRGRGFFADGSERFSDRVINNVAAGDQLDPKIAMADDGSFVVVWTDDQDSDKIYEISARRFNANGTPRFPQFVVNPETAGIQSQPSVDMNAAGDFIVAWRDDADMNFYSQILASGFDANGTSRFTGRTLNQIATASQYRPQIAIRDDGSFVAAWIDQGQQVMARVFETDGTPNFDDLIVNQNRFQLHDRPAVTVADDGSFLVAWQELDAAGNWRMRGQALGLDGQGDGVFELEGERGGDQRSPRVVIR